MSMEASDLLAICGLSLTGALLVVAALVQML